MRTLPLVAGLALASAAGAQVPLNVVINEILYDPWGTDAGLERIEIKNNDIQEANLSGYSLAICYPGTLLNNRTYWPFGSNFKIPPGDVVTVHYLEDGLDTLTDFYTGASGAQFICITPPKSLGNDVGSIAIYNTTNCSLFSSFINIVDFVQWGGSTHHEVQAQVAGIWQSGTWIDDIAEGRALAYDGGGDLPENWWTDVSPTFGLYNESPGSPSITSYGSGCVGSTGIPALGTTGGPAALGNYSFALELSGALPGAPALVAVAANTGSVPALGCTIELDLGSLMFQTGSVTIDPGGQGQIPLPIVDDFNLIGTPFHFQGGVIDPGSPSGIVAFSTAMTVVI